MHICAGWDRWEEELGEAEGESVAHSVDKDVGCEEGEGVVGRDKGAKGLSEEGHVWPA